MGSILRVEQNPAFSSAALGMGWALATVLEDGEVSPGTSVAYALASEFEQLFGTPFMGGVLQSGDWLPIDMVDLVVFYEGDMTPDEIRIARARARRILNAYFQGARWLLGAQGTPEPHHYTWSTRICHTSTSGCTLENVFIEMRRYPVEGRSDQCGDIPRSRCEVAVDTGHETEVFILVAGPVGKTLGTVRHFIEPSAYRLTDETLEDHSLHPGEVVRQATIDNDGYIVTTTEGTGEGPFADMNEVFGPANFHGIDLEIAGRM